MLPERGGLARGWLRGGQCAARWRRARARWLALRAGWLAVVGCGQPPRVGGFGWPPRVPRWWLGVGALRAPLAFELDLTSRISVQGFFCWCPFCGFLFPDVLAGIFGDWSFRRSWSWLTNLQALLIIVTLLWLAFWGTSPWNTTPPIGKIDKRMSPCLGFCG